MVDQPGGVVTCVSINEKESITVGCVCGNDHMETSPPVLASDGYWWGPVHHG